MSILSSIGRFLFGGGSNSQSNTSFATNQQQNTTTNEIANTSGDSFNITQNNPTAGIEELIAKYLPTLSNIYTENGGVSDLEGRAYEEIDNLANDSSGIDAALAENNKTIRGDYLNPETNPYLKDIAERMGSSALQKINAQFGSAGRTGSGLAGYFAGQGVGAAVGDVYGANYNTERGRQQAAVGLSPVLDSARYTGANAMAAAGQQLSARPYNQSQQYISLLDQIGKIAGSTTSLGNTSNNVTGNTNSTGTLTGSTTGTTNTTGQAESSGIVGNFINKFLGTAATNSANKLFPEA